MIDILLSSLIISMLCHTIDILLRKGNLLYFIKKIFYYNKVDEINSWWLNKYNDIFNNSINYSQSEINIAVKKLEEEKEKKLNSLSYLKPILTCVVCFASIWGTIFFTILNYYGFIDFKYFPVVILLTVFFNDTIQDIRLALQK